MDATVFNNDYLHLHELSKHCLSRLNDVSNRDYPGTDYFNNEIDCLDMDSYETSVCHGEADRTTDAVIGISSCKNKTLSNPRLLLVELRLGYKNVHNLSKTEMENKVKHTRELLVSHLVMERKSLFVFSEKVAPQARRWVSNYANEGGEVKNFIVYSVNEFGNNIQSYRDLPYTPINPPEQTEARLVAYVESQQWNALFKQIHYWLNYAGNIRNSNAFEYENIKDIILTVWKRFKSGEYVLHNEDDELESMILEEDISACLK